MINYAYKEIYGVKNVSLYYIFNKGLYKKIRYLYIIFGIKFLKKVSGFNKFMIANKKIDIFNKKKKIYYQDCNGNKCNKDIMSLYNESINKSLEYIDKVNSYLHEE